MTSLFLKVGITLDSPWFEPRHDNAEDRAAAERALQFHLGIYANPIFVNGDYPEIVKTLVAQKSRAGGLRKSRLPSFTQAEKAMIKGTHDFFAYNTYSSYLVKNHNFTNSGPNGTTPQSVETDQVSMALYTLVKSRLKIVPISPTNLK